ncbi:hypothetical protein GCM10009765_58800 [Fodinicola feengrottensis]|uniref:Uncharacterized protein n=1 Tax=Fodinicola feengrottensis TaxID=435914 RepID=A0ABN2IB92_9ACTN
MSECTHRGPAVIESGGEFLCIDCRAPQGEWHSTYRPAAAGRAYTAAMGAVQLKGPKMAEMLMCNRCKHTGKRDNTFTHVYASRYDSLATTVSIDLCEGCRRDVLAFVRTAPNQQPRMRLRKRVWLALCHMADL